MEARKYLYPKLKELVRNHPELKLKCEYDQLAEGFYIEVSPSDFFDQAEKAMAEISFDFMNIFPYQSITFFRFGDVIEIEKPEQVFTGSLHELANTAIKYNFVEAVGGTEPLSASKENWPLNEDIQPQNPNVDIRRKGPKSKLQTIEVTVMMDMTLESFNYPAFKDQDIFGQTDDDTSKAA